MPRSSMETSPAGSNVREATQGANAEAVPSEAFGQEGVLQYVWPTVARASLWLAALGIALWVRSHEVQYRLIRATGQYEVLVSSLHGRFAILMMPSAKQDSGWAFQIQALPQDLWTDPGSLAVGFQVLKGPGNRLPPQATLVRVRWRNIVGLLLVCPAIHGFQRLRRRRGGWV